MSFHNKICFLILQVSKECPSQNFINLFALVRPEQLSTDSLLSKLPNICSHSVPTFSLIFPTIALNHPTFLLKFPNKTDFGFVKKLEQKCWVKERKCWVIETKCWKLKRAIVRSFWEHKFGGNKPQPKIEQRNEKELLPDSPQGHLNLW